MSLFHSGMNHWQRQWLSDRLHKKTEASAAPPVLPPSRDVARPRKVRGKAKPPGKSAG